MRMITRLVAGAALAALLAGPALAQAPAASPEECLDQAFDLAQAAEKKNLDEAKLDKLEEMLTKMEAHCDVKELAEAAAVAKEIRGVIGN
jgi:hypothetical protein